MEDSNAAYHIYSNKSFVTYKNGWVITCEPDVDIRLSPHMDRWVKMGIQSLLHYNAHIVAIT